MIRYYSLVLLMTVLFISCNRNILETNDIAVIKNLAECENVIVFDVGGKLEIELVNSKILEQEERKVFSNMIVYTIYNQTLNKRDFLDVNGVNTIVFKTNDSTDAYKVSNKNILVLDKTFKELYKLLNMVLNEGDITSFYDTNELSSKEISELSELIKNEIVFLKGYKLDIYGCELGIDFAQVYVKFVVNGVRKNLVFKYSKESLKLIGLNIITV